MKKACCPLLAASLLLLGASAFAQTPQTPQHAPDGGMIERFASVFIPSTPNAPFTATVNTEWIRQLPDGSSITLKNHRTVARDAAGRIFQERRYFVPDDGKHESYVTQIEISDPIAHERYVCRPADHVCQVERFSGLAVVNSPAPAALHGKPGAGDVENLGTQTIAGLETIGTRETRLIEAGTVGNDAPILERREYWYSPQLGLNLITRRQDPRFSTQQNLDVTDIARGEPDSKLFEVPNGYKILDMRNPAEPSPSRASSAN